MRDAVALQLIAMWLFTWDLVSIHRLMLTIGLLEFHASSPQAINSSAVIQRLMTRRAAILPRVLLALKADSRNLGNPRWSDFYVIRNEWSCYVPGEIADIDNILRGEERKRVHQRIDEIETIELKEEAIASLDERNHQSTERHELEEQAAIQTQFQLGVEAQVDTAGQYGPTHVETHAGVTLSYAASEARSRAVRSAQEIVDVAKSRVEQKVRSLRSTRTLQRVIEKNLHKFDNSNNPVGHVRGIFRWVDKIQRLQVFRYPHRMVFDFELPEPGQYLFELWQPTRAAMAVPKDPGTWALDPRNITRKNYQGFVDQFEAEGVVPPPEAQLAVSVALSLKADAGAQGAPTILEDAKTVPEVAGAVEIAIPGGYVARQFKVSVAAPPVMAKWWDHNGHDFVPDDGVIPFVGYHNIVAKCVCGGRTASMALWPGGNNVWSTVDTGLVAVQQERWVNLETPNWINIQPSTAKVQAAVTIAGAFQASASLSVDCSLTQEAFEKWQQETWDTLHRSWLGLKQKYDDWLANQDPSPVVTIAGKSPAANAEEIRQELKRQVIEMVINAPLQPPQLTIRQENVPSPYTKFARQYGEAVRFFEQAFEWKNITYITYPTYWAPRSRWTEINRRECVDDELRRFLRAGSARVVVPARPGFEYALLYFGLTGQLWGGGPAPLPGDPLYVSIAQEIADALGAPDEGEPLDMWEVKLPTTLVWLDSDSDIPKHNQARRLKGTPTIAICED